MTDYQLIRSKRRTLSIGIDGEGALVVRAPMRMPKRDIEAFIREKEGWIAQKQALVRERLQKADAAQLADGAQVPFRGGTLTMRLEACKRAFDAEGILHLPKGEEPLKHALKWRTERARQLIVPRVDEWARATGLRPEKIAFGNAQKRWGSMSSLRSLRLNAALIHVPPQLCDYIIVHELCHMVHPDHSPAFHALVRSILPGAEALRTQLKGWSYVLSMWR